MDLNQPLSRLKSYLVARRKWKRMRRRKNRRRRCCWCGRHKDSVIDEVGEDLHVVTNIRKLPVSLQHRFVNTLDQWCPTIFSTSPHWPQLWEQMLCCRPFCQNFRKMFCIFGLYCHWFKRTLSHRFILCMGFVIIEFTNNGCCYAQAFQLSK